MSPLMKLNRWKARERVKTRKALANGTLKSEEVSLAYAVAHFVKNAKSNVSHVLVNDDDFE